MASIIANFELELTADEYGTIVVRETNASIAKRVARTFGFDEKKVNVLNDYCGSVAQEFTITVCGYAYEIVFGLGYAEDKITRW